MYHKRVYADNVVSKFWLLRSFSSQRQSKFIAYLATDTVSQILAKECKARFSICKVNLNFLRSSRHFDCDTAFAALLPFLNESVHGFNRIRNEKEETGYQIVKFGRI